MELPETVEIEPSGEAEGAVIWLHGLGADGHDFEPIVPELALDGRVALRFVFPHAPVRPVTINGGMAMRAWYDIMSLERDGPEDEAGIRASGERLAGLVGREEARGIASDRITVAGFSQGGAIALHAALRYPRPLAGVMALSTYLPRRSAFGAAVTAGEIAQGRDLSVFMAHGRYDPVLPIVLGEGSRDLLGEAGFDVEWHEYPMAHAVCADEIADIRRWLLAVYSRS